MRQTDWNISMIDKGSQIFLRIQIELGVFNVQCSFLRESGLGGFDVVLYIASLDADFPSISPFPWCCPQKLSQGCCLYRMHYFV